MDENKPTYEELEKKVAELEKRNNYLESVLHYAPEATITIDSLSRVLDWNSKAERLFGYSKEQAKGRNLEELISDPSVSQQVNIKQILSQDYLSGTEAVRYTKQGRRVQVIVSGSSLDIGGDSKGAVIVYTDISKQNHLEEQIRESSNFFRFALDAVPSYISVLNEHGDIVFVNKPWRDLAKQNNADPEKVSEGVNYLDICYKTSDTYADKARDFANGIEKVISGERSFYYMEYPCYLSNKDLWFLGRVMPFPTSAPRHVVVAHNDITERKRGENLRQSVERIMRHDLKSPLNGIIGMSNLLEMEEGLDSEQREYVTHIQNSGYNMLNMIDHSMDIFHMEEDTYQLKPQEFDLMQVLQGLVTESDNLVKSKSISLDIFIQNSRVNWESKYLLTGEKQKIWNMLSNLLVNALEASPQGERVTFYLESNKDGHWISIHNKGEIPDSLRNKFFEAYTSLGKSKGTGLGTYSARLIARAHGGNIDFSSSSKEGTIVTVFIPKIHTTRESH